MMGIGLVVWGMPDETEGRSSMTDVISLLLSVSSIVAPAEVAGIQ